MNDQFKFAMTSPLEVAELIKTFDNSSSSGITGIPVKVPKHFADELSIVLCDFINSVFKSGRIPNEWKYALISLLYNGKGDTSSFDNSSWNKCANSFR